MSFEGQPSFAAFSTLPGDSVGFDAILAHAAWLYVTILFPGAIAFACAPLLGRNQALGVGAVVIGSHHHQQPVRGGHGRKSLYRLAQTPRQILGVGRLAELATQEVAEREVFGSDPAAIRRLPPERGAIDLIWDSAPHDGSADPGHPQDLRHLADVPELVREIADPRAAAELRGPAQATFQVPDVRFPRREELVHLREPRAGRELPRSSQPFHVSPPVGPDGKVVVDHRGLPVQVEVREARVQQLDQPVHHRDQHVEEPFERQVPLAVPVRVRDQRDLSSIHGASVPRGSPGAPKCWIRPSAQARVEPWPRNRCASLP